MDITGFVYISEITRYYNNSFYLENGYLPIRTDNQNVGYLNQGGIYTMQGELTKREIKVYNSDVLDTSLVTFLDFGDDHETYDTSTVTTINLKNDRISGVEYYWRQSRRIYQE